MHRGERPGQRGERGRAHHGGKKKRSTPKERALVAEPNRAHDRELIFARPRIMQGRVDGAREPRVFRARILEDEGEAPRVRVRRVAPRSGEPEIEIDVETRIDSSFHPQDPR